MTVFGNDFRVCVGLLCLSTQYHGGGAAATLEPLSEHLADYRAHMMQNYGTGVQACYRGHRLYDTEETKQTVKEIIDWYKRYRYILNKRR